MNKTFTSSAGSIELSLVEGISNTFQIIPKGIISLSLLKEYLTFIERLDRQHTKKFNHIVDTTQVKFANPLNPIYLRRISRLKNINYYIVIVPSVVLRTLVRMTKWINKPDYVFKSIRDARDFLKESNLSYR